MKSFGRRTSVSVVLTVLLALSGGTVIGFADPSAPDGTIQAWGRNSKGQVGPHGTGNPTESRVPVDLADVTAVSAGYDHSVALKTDGTVWAWGSTKDGELGDGTLCDPESAQKHAKLGTPPNNCGPASRASPVQVMELSPDPAKPVVPGSALSVTKRITSLTGVKQVAAGYFHTLALKSDGTVWAWGRNCSGQLGLLPGANVESGGTTVATNASPFAVQVIGLKRPIVKLSAGVAHSLALDDRGVLWSWGADFWGQLGRGLNPEDPQETKARRDSICSDRFGAQTTGPESQSIGRGYPGPVMLPGPVVDMAAGSDHSLALTADGNVWAFGNNCNGQLGPSLPGGVRDAKRGTPLPVRGLPGLTDEDEDRVVSLAAGGYSVEFPPDGWFDGGHSLALTQSGKVYGWGLPDSSGQSTTSTSSCPRPVPRSGALEQLRMAVAEVHATPGLVTGASDIAAISGAALSSFAIKNDGTLLGWGRNDSVQLGPALGSDTTQVATSAVTIPLCRYDCAEGVNRKTGAVSARFHTLALLGTPPVRPACRDICLSGVVDDVDEAIDEAEERVDEIEGGANRAIDNTREQVDKIEGDGDTAIGETENQSEDLQEQTFDRRERLPAGGGGIFVTGRTPDADGAGQTPHSGTIRPESEVAKQRRILRRAIEYVTPGSAPPKILYVMATRTHGHGAYGMERAGFKHLRDTRDVAGAGCPQLDDGERGCFYTTNVMSSVADLPDEYRADLDLEPVNFYNFDVVVVGFNIGEKTGEIAGAGLQTREMDVLERRRAELLDYVSSGHGLVAVDQPDDQVKRFLPFLEPRRFAQGIAPGPRIGFTPTPQGREAGLDEADLNGGFGVSGWFESCGLDVLERFADGRVASMSSHEPIPPPGSGFCASVSDTTVKEGNSGTTPGVFNVTADPSRNTSLSVNYRTENLAARDGEAKGGRNCHNSNSSDGSDYISTTGTLTFPPGFGGPVQVTVPVCGDSLPEPDERFLLHLSSPDNPVFQTTALGTIVDDDTVVLPQDGSGTAAGSGLNPVRSQDPDAFLGLNATAGAKAAVGAGAAAPALAAPAPATAAETAASQAHAQAQAQAQASSQVPQFGAAMEKEKQSQAETAYVDPGQTGMSELLASALTRGPVLPVALMIGALFAGMSFGFVHRRSGPELQEEFLTSGSEKPPDGGSCVRLERIHGRR